jgi:hypothetical protein
MEWRGSCASDFFPHDRIRPIESRLVGSTDFATKLPELYEAVAKMGGAEFLNAGSVISTDGVDGLHLTAASEAEARSCRCREGEGDGSRAGPPSNFGTSGPTHAAGSESKLAIPARTRLDGAGKCPKGQYPRAIHAAW